MGITFVNSCLKGNENETCGGDKVRSWHTRAISNDGDHQPLRVNTYVDGLNRSNTNRNGYRKVSNHSASERCISTISILTTFQPSTSATDILQHIQHIQHNNAAASSTDHIHTVLYTEPAKIFIHPLLNTTQLITAARYDTTEPDSLSMTHPTRTQDLREHHANS